MGEATLLRPLQVGKCIVRLVATRLADHGFRLDAMGHRGVGAVYVRRRRPHIEDWITLPTDVADAEGSVSVTANLGVHCPTLDRTLAVQYAERSTSLATLTRNIGQLSPRRTWQEWRFSAATYAPDAADELADTIEGVGLRWLEQFDGLRALRDGFAALGHREHHRISLPALDRLVAAEDGEPGGAAPPASFDLAAANDASLWQGED